MSLNLKKLNKDFDKKMNEILDNMSIEYLKNLFKEKVLRKKKIEEIEEEEPEEKEYIDFPILVSQEVIDLKRKFEEAIFEDDEKKEEPKENESNNENYKDLSNQEIEFLEFLQNNSSEDGKLPKTSEIMNALNLEKIWEVKDLKKKLEEHGILSKINERVYLLKPEYLKNTNQ